MTDIQPVFENLTHTEGVGKKKLQTLIQEHKLMVIESDKNMGLTIIHQTLHNSRIQDEIQRLGDLFQVIPSETITEKESACIIIRNQLLTIIKNNIRHNPYKKELLKYLEDNSCQHFQELRALPKLHKQENRMRILLPFHINIFSTIHTFLAKVLQPIASRMVTSLTSSFELVQKLEKYDTLEDNIIVTADLENMYNRINRSLAIDLVVDKIKEYNQKFFMFGTNMERNIIIWKQILKLAFDHCWFKHDNKLIKQTQGVPMGSAAGPVLAIIYINGIIEINRSKPELSHIFKHLPLIKLYIDDGFFITRDLEKHQITQIINLLISHERSSVMWEDSSITMKSTTELLTQKLAFLDMNLSTQHSNGTFKFHSSVAYKKQASYSYIHWKSAHPKAIKRAVIKGELSRRIRLSSSIEAWTETYKDLTTKLLRRKYPINEITTAIAHFSYEKRRSYLNRTCAKILKRRTQSTNPFTSSTGITNTLIPIVIRYDPRNHRYIKKLRKWIEEQLIDRSKIENWTFRLVIAYYNDKKSRLLSSIKTPHVSYTNHTLTLHTLPSESST
jgi:hypothetical protein